MSPIGTKSRKNHGKPEKKCPKVSLSSRSGPRGPREQGQDPAASLLEAAGHHNLVVLDGGPQDWVQVTGGRLETGG
jgi:hypothetical protein